jgi:hypothetical protein
MCQQKSSKNFVRMLARLRACLERMLACLERACMLPGARALAICLVGARMPALGMLAGACLPAHAMRLHALYAHAFVHHALACARLLMRVLLYAHSCACARLCAHTKWLEPLSKGSISRLRTHAGSAQKKSVGLSVDRGPPPPSYGFHSTLH